MASHLQDDDDSNSLDDNPFEYRNSNRKLVTYNNNLNKNRQSFSPTSNFHQRPKQQLQHQNELRIFSSFITTNQSSSFSPTVSWNPILNTQLNNNKKSQNINSEKLHNDSGILINQQRLNQKQFELHQSSRKIRRITYFYYDTNYYDSQNDEIKNFKLITTKNTSINGFNNSRNKKRFINNFNSNKSTQKNNVKHENQFKEKTQTFEIKNKKNHQSSIPIDSNIREKHLHHHNHQIRSIIDGSTRNSVNRQSLSPITLIQFDTQQQFHPRIASIQLNDHFNVAWLEPAALSLIVLLSITIVGVIFITIVILYWLKNLLSCSIDSKRNNNKTITSKTNHRSIVQIENNSPTIAADRMDNKEFRKTLENYRSAVQRNDGNATAAATEEITVALRNLVLNTTSNCNIGVELIRQNSMPSSNQIQITIEDPHLEQQMLQQQQSIRSSTPTSQSCQVLSSQTASPTYIRRISSYERRHSQSPRRLSSLRSDCCEDLTNEPVHQYSSSSPTTPIPNQAPTTPPTVFTVTSGRHSNRNSPKFFERCSNDDKENESPILGELLINSPKMKLTEHVLAQQNSPRIYDSSSITRFSFSPKQVYSNEICAAGASTIATSVPGSIATPATSTTLQNTINSSPLLSSAVYKHGNYFKFPEVDCFTPDKLLNNLSTNSSSITTQTLSTTTATSSIGSKLYVGNQATRRARLKSISLDSDGARLVEDNLGIPVEELIDITNQSPPDIGDECFQREIQQMSQSNDHKFKSTSTTSAVTSNLSSGETAVISTTFSNKHNRKNKNNLTINIETDEPHSVNLNKNKNNNNSTTLIKIQTPTLNRTKQKAVSLDSSDTNNILYCCVPSSSMSISSSGTGRGELSYPIHQHHHQRLTPISKSLLHVSSVSVPTTPKRNISVVRKKSFGKSAVVKGIPKIPIHQHHHSPVASSSCGVDRQLIGGRTIDDDRIVVNVDDDVGCFDLNDDCYSDDTADEVVVVEEEDDATEVGRDNRNLDVTDTEKSYKSTEYSLLGTNLQQNQKYNTLSLSNNNLKTLPEVMTLSDFTNPAILDPLIASNAGFVASHQHYHSHQADDAKAAVNVSSKTTPPARNNILQRRGSNHSLTLNLNGSLGNLTKCLSVSNYSLGSFSGSNYNLNHHSQQPQHQPQHQQHQHHQQPSSTQSIAARGYSSSQTNILLPRASATNQHQQVNAAADMANSNVNFSKKNLLQRRGSNTSLTLNIKGSSCASLSRFNSHSSLNISSMHHLHQSSSTNVGAASTKFKQQPQQQLQQPHMIHHYHPQLQHHQQPFQQHGQSGSKKGLLERRNSNASLTLNIQNRGLSISNCNLRASACSLNSITNPTEYFDPSVGHFENSNAAIVDSAIGGSSTAAQSSTGGGPKQQRKFLSSENLNSISQCSKLNQTHVRNSTKTCFGSVSDLKPNQQQSIHQSPASSNYFHQQSFYYGGPAAAINDDMPRHQQFEQTDLCSCTGVRNITTKPLSPQSTSEDFKMYLANIQLLQNATNTLTDEHLRKLNFIFQRSYQPKQPANSGIPMDDGDAAANNVAAALTTTTIIAEPKVEQVPATLPLQHFDFNVSPSDDEQKHLLRSLHEEFWDLPTNHQEKPLVFGSQAKNRYKTILPNEHSRVMLETEDGSLHEPYINANYIKGPDYTQNAYIATQGPLPNTIYDYWLMTVQNIQNFHRNYYEQQHREQITDKHDNQNDSQVMFSNFFTNNRRRMSQMSRKNTKFQKMIMLTNFVENTQQKCSIYFPIEKNETIFITNSNEKFENERLATFYEKYLNFDVDNGNGDVEIDLEIDIDQSSSSTLSIRSDQVPLKNYFVIKNVGKRMKNGFTIRKFVGLYVIVKQQDGVDQPSLIGRAIIKQTLRRFICFHYWFPDWPDHRSPTDVNVLLDMSLHLLDVTCYGEFYDSREDQDIDDGHLIVSDQKNVLEPIMQGMRDNEPLPIIHCSAGIGRTGCLAAILNGIRQIRGSIQLTLKPSWNFELTSQSLDLIKTKKNYVNVDILGIVCNLRLQRGGMVQNSEQYELIHRVLCLYQARIDSDLLNSDREIIVQSIKDRDHNVDDNDDDTDEANDQDDDDDDDDNDDDELNQTSII